MLSLVACIRDQHDYLMIALAAGVCLLGSHTFFLLWRRAQECEVHRRGTWLAAAAFAGGAGVWATHFLAMLAYNAGTKMSFALMPTLLSILFIISIWWGGLRLHERFKGTAGLVMLGVVLTMGITVMHFTGMTGLKVPARMEIDIISTVVGVIVSILWTSAAVLVFFRAPHRFKHIGATLLLVLGIVTLHFNSMSAVSFVPDPRIYVPEAGVDRYWLTAAIFVAILILIGLSALAVFVDRYLTDLRGLIDATLEGFMIVHNERIVQANEALATLCGISVANMEGRNPNEILHFETISGIADLGPDVVEAHIQPRNGEARFIETSAHLINFRGRLCQVIAVRDVTEKREAQLKIEHLARHDALTGLPNRHLLDERLGQALTRAERTGGQVALIALDLDRFKAVNDIFGHAKGDEVLCRVSEILTAQTRASDTVSRLGGDEFVIVQDLGEQPDAAHALTRRILDTFNKEMNLAADPTAVGVSIGIAIYPNDAKTALSLKHSADIALYRAKQSGRGMASFFAPSMDEDVRNRRQLEHDLRHAVQLQQMSLAYQPLVDSSSGDVVGYEALLRWNHPERGLIEPDIFIPVAEESGAIIQIGEWVIREACREAASWKNAHRVSVNVSSVQFQLSTLSSVVRHALRDSGLEPSRLDLEVTEAVLLKNKVGALEIFHQLKALGVGLVMDDFGTGYSSLNNLQTFPFDKLKIDRSFIRLIENDEAARSIVRAIAGLGRSLNLTVVAEGVETEAQHRMIIEEGCPQAQGYLFGAPHTLEAETEDKILRSQAS
ncbi:MAG: EAL domain-containing protein [Asticcacaulis sp.]